MAGAVEFDPNAPSEVASAPEFDPNAPSEVAAAIPAPRSFLDRAKDVASSVVSKTGESFANLGHTIASAARGAVDLASPISKEGGLQVPFGQLSDPAYRHELERGVSDTVTGGLATKAANAVDPGFAAGEAAEHEAAPNARALGQVGGTALPSPFNYIGGQAAKLVPGAGPLAAATKGVVGYEASAVPQAVVVAEPGHRAEAAAEAATNPAGIVTSAAIPAVTSYLGKKLDTAATKAPAVELAARERAVKDLGKDITDAEGSKSRATDQKRIAEVNERLYDLADKNPELRQAFGEPAEKALPKIQAFKDKIAAPLDKLYDAIDEKTGGGLDPRQVVQEFRDMAKEAKKSVAGYDDATRLNKLADRFEEVYITDREPSEAPPMTQQHGVGRMPEGLADQIQALEKLRENAKGATAEGIDKQLAKARAEAGIPEHIEEEPTAKETAARSVTDAVPSHIAEETTVREKYVPIQKTADAKVAELDATHPFGEHTRETVGDKIPTQVFRREVTDLLKKSDSIMGGIEGTPRFEALQRLYDAGKKVIDKHIDNSGLSAEEIAQVRDINNGYFLVSRAEQAIESRGWKEANRPGFKLAHTLNQAIHSPAGAGGAATAALYAATHPHAIPYLVGTAAVAKGLPIALKAINWDMAHGGYTRAIQNLAKVAKATASVGQFVSQATRAGLAADQARRVWEAAHKAPVTPTEAGDITL